MHFLSQSLQDSLSWINAVVSWTRHRRVNGVIGHSSSARSYNRAAATIRLYQRLPRHGLNTLIKQFTALIMLAWVLPSKTLRGTLQFCPSPCCRASKSTLGAQRSSERQTWHPTIIRLFGFASLRRTVKSSYRPTRGQQTFCYRRGSDRSAHYTMIQVRC